MKHVAVDTNTLIDLVGLTELDELRGLGFRRPTINQAVNSVSQSGEKNSAERDELHRNVLMVAAYLEHRIGRGKSDEVRVVAPDFVRVELNDVCNRKAKEIRDKWGSGSYRRGAPN